MREGYEGGSGGAIVFKRRRKEGGGRRKDEERWGEKRSVDGWKERERERKEH